MKPQNMTWIEISRSAFNHNIEAIKAAIGQRMLAIVMKANAYGHGMQEIAQLAQEHPDVDWLCVAFASEALALRRMEVSKPILVMSCIDIDLQELIGTNIALMIDTYETALALHEVGTQHRFIFPIHLKIDTGLSRFGVPAGNAVPLIEKLKQLSHISLQGLYSHFSESDKEDPSFTHLQIERFRALLGALKDTQTQIPLIHFSNSAAATTLDLPFCTMFRVGINAYGLWSSPHVRDQAAKRHPAISLHPILTFKSRIISIKELPPQSFVGYSRAFQTTRPTRMAIIPVGYYDGYDIRFSNNGVLYCHNQTASIIGRVAMNTIMIDITDIPQAQLYDEVTLMGNFPGITPYDMNMRIQNMNIRELTTKINPFIVRIISP